MKYTYLSLILLSLLTACGVNEKKTDTVNGKPFSAEKATELLTDIQVFESMISTHNFFQDKEEQKMIFQAILEKHHFTLDEYDSTLTYLGKNLVLYQEILDSVKVKVEKMKKIELPYVKTRYTLTKDGKQPSLRDKIRK